MVIQYVRKTCIMRLVFELLQVIINQPTYHVFNIFIAFPLNLLIYVYQIHTSHIMQNTQLHQGGLCLT